MFLTDFLNLFFEHKILSKWREFEFSWIKEGVAFLCCYKEDTRSYLIRRGPRRKVLELYDQKTPGLKSTLYQNSYLDPRSPKVLFIKVSEDFRCRFDRQLVTRSFHGFWRNVFIQKPRLHGLSPSSWQDQVKIRGVETSY